MTMNREKITVADFFNSNIKYDVFFHRNQSSTTPQGKVRFFYAQSTPIDIGKNFAKLDYESSENLIGQIVNLSQVLNSKLWDEMNSNKPDENTIKQLYKDVCQLSIMSEFAMWKNQEGQMQSLMQAVTDSASEKVIVDFFNNSQICTQCTSHKILGKVIK